MQLLYEEVLGRVPVEHLGNKWLPLPFWNHASTPTFYRLVKRLVDIALGLAGLLILALLFPFVALAIKLESRGPVFYRQERLGRGGKSFQITKFRSMVTNAEQQGKAVWATRDDPRITRVGKLLRRTRLDEFPQVLSVLKGDMSIIGPRPERQQFVDQLQEEIPFYRARLSVKPGLTGWAQVKYRYGSTKEDALVKLQYDLYYIKHQSLLLDLLIILRTIKVMLAFKGT
jgi:exopolysaccharide biosynthesis polyprenyl glycosylphosphotransferase